MVSPSADAAADPHKLSLRLRQAVTIEGMTEHLEALQDVADQYGDRAAGRPGFEASAEYVEGVLQDVGYDTRRQYFDFQYEEVLAANLTETSPTERDFDVHVFTYSPNTPEGGITAQLAAPAQAEGCTAEAWDGVDVADKIALVSRGTCPFAQKSVVAGQAGAEAIVIYNNIPGALGGTLSAENPEHIPTGGILQTDGQALLEQMASGPVTVNVELRVLKETRRTFNVITEFRGEKSKNVIMLGAHLDGVQDGPGINDNGTGSSALLEIAEQLSEFKPLENTIRFAWWGAEENGLLGSTHYVNDLMSNNKKGLNRIATYLNFDMIGSPNYIIGVYDADGSSYPPSAPVPPGSVQTERVFRDYFDSIGQDVVDYQFTGRSDYQAFINNGVAAGGLSTGSNGLKSEHEQALFGGTAGVSYDYNYHSPADDITNVAFEALDVQADAIAHAVIALGRDASLVDPKVTGSTNARTVSAALPEGVTRR
jgi:Zn-dependent M28 family amino/carboxypeptidase